MLALLILRAQPANRIAWLFLICGVGIAASMGLIYGGEQLLLADVSGATVVAVTLATWALPVSSTTAIVLATLACAAAFQPLRRRLQDAVDRRFNPIRARGEQELDAYTSRLRSELTPEDVAADLLAVVGRTVEPRSAAVWLPPR